MFNIMKLNNIKNIFYWTDNNGAVYLPGDTALTYRTKSDLPRFVAAVYSALNTDSGVSERVVTLNGHCGLLLDVLYDKDWVSETFSNLNCEIPDEIIMNLFGAALPCLAQIMWNDIHASLNKTEHCSNCPDLRILVGQNTDKDGHELCFFIPFGGTEFDDDWTPMSTPLKAYKKDMRSIKPAGNYEEGKDYMVAVSPWVLEAFLKANQIDYVQLIRGQDLKNPPVGSIRYANEKEVVWYEYSSATTTRRCTDLSRAKSFVQGWVNLDCPTLKRFSTNQKVLSVNGFGAAVPLFESPLVDTSYVDTVIADDIEDKEIEGLRKHLNPDGVISQLLNNVQKARAEKGIDEVESRVKQVETQIRLFLRTPEIENEIKDIETAHLNEEGSFDCGFIFWYPKADSQLEKDMSLLVGANRRKLSWLDIAVPTFSQSINVQRYGAELIKKLVKERLGIELYYRSELD